MQTEENSNPAAKIVPDELSNLSKKEQVAEMFNSIAGKYDFLNHTLSMGIDKGWRKKAIRQIASVNPKNILDVATGTADLAIAAAGLNPSRIVGVDIADGMLEIGRKKIAEKKLSHIVSLQNADSEHLPFPNNQFDAVICAYGVRNFEHLHAGLAEMSRVMRPGGKLAVLEFSRPKSFPIKQLFSFYFRYVLPALGRIVSKHSRAYTYLNESAMAFPEGPDFCHALRQSGFKDPKATRLSFGITTLYTASK